MTNSSSDDDRARQTAEQFIRLALEQKESEAEPAPHSPEVEKLIAHMREGHVLSVQGEPLAALSEYYWALRIAEKQEASVPRNRSWQDELSGSFISVGDRFLKMEWFREARDSYKGAIAIFKQLQTSEPNNDYWDRGMAVSLGRMAELLVRERNFPEALEQRTISHEMFQRLAAAGPTHEGRQRDLAISFGRLGILYAEQGDRNRALKEFARGREIALRLKEQDTTAWFDQRIAAVIS